MTTTVTSVNSSIVSAQLVAANAQRTGLRFVNTDGNRLLLLQGSGTAGLGNNSDYLDENDGATISGPEAKEAWQGVWVGDGTGSVHITETTTVPLAGPGTKSILTIIQEAAPRIGLAVPSAVFSSTTRELIEIQEVANDCAQMCARSHRWRNLLQTATYTGDGSTEDFDLPDDFDWMPDGEDIWGSENKVALEPVTDTNDWLGREVLGLTNAFPAWILYGRQIHIRPALPDSETAQHFYQSTAVCSNDALTPKSSFTLDTDLYRLDERLLKLAIVYRWRMLKELPYAEQMNDYEDLKEKLIFRDKGATSLVLGRKRFPSDVRIAFPGTVG